jgi:hypothetical protein
MKSLRVKSILAIFCFLLGNVSAFATSLELVGTSGIRSAKVTFSDATAGGVMTITLENIGGEVSNPSELLTALFFDINGVGALTPVSALLGSSLVAYGPDGGGNVGGEWQYLSGLAGAPGGATEGISSAGFGLFGSGNFGGPNLEGPAAVNGMNYGIVSAIDNLAAGNAAVTGGVPLIKNSVTFTVSGLPSLFNPSATGAITNVSFQYGTALDEPNIPCCGQEVPEPTSFILLGSGLLAASLAARALRKK